MRWPSAIASRGRRPIRWGSGRVAAAGLAALLALPATPARARDEGADGHFSRRESAHFVLLQDVDIDQRSGRYGSRRFEIDVLAQLEAAFDRVDRELGLRPRRPVEVVVYDPARFDATFAGLFRFSAAGFYHGVIRVRGSTRIDGALMRVLQHEYVHAALDAAAPSLVLPGWLNEGVAEWMEHRAVGLRNLGGWEAESLARTAAAGELLGFDALSAPSFAGLGPEAAPIAYLQSYAFIDHLVRQHGEHALRTFLETLLRTRRLDRACRRAFKRTFPQLTAGFFAAWSP